MARTIWFWSETLGLRLTKTIALPDGGQHFFLDGGRGASIAYFWWPNVQKAQPGVSNVSIEKLLTELDFRTAAGSVNHVAFNVPEELLEEYRQRIEKTGVFVSPMLYHADGTESGYSAGKDENTTWISFYFAGPDGEYLELTAQTTREFTKDRDILSTPAHQANLEN